MNTFSYEVRAEPDEVLRALGNAISPETSSNLLYIDDADTELVGLTDGLGRVSVRRRRGLFAGFSGALRLDLAVSQIDGGSRVVGHYRLGSMALTFRLLYVAVFLAVGVPITAVAISGGSSVLVGGVVAVVFVLTQIPLEHATYVDRRLLRAEVEKALLRAGAFSATR